MKHTLGLILFITMVLAAGRCMGDLYLDDGGSYTIEDTVSGSLYVDYNVPPSTGTTVEIIAPGEVMDTVYTYGTSELTINRGSVGGGQYVAGIVAADTSRGAVESGTIGDTIVGLADSAFRFSGGSIQGDFVIAAGEIGNYDRSTFVFVGSDFLIDGQPAPYGVYDTGGTGFRAGSIAGTLADGNPFGSPYTMYDGGSIVLVPEPLTLAALVPGGVAIAMRRRRRI